MQGFQLGRVYDEVEEEEGLRRGGLMGRVT